MVAIQRGSPHSQWNLSPADFETLHDQKGNGRNLSVLADSWFGMLVDCPSRDDKPYRVTSRFYRELSDPATLPNMIQKYAELGKKLISSTHVGTDGATHVAPLFREFAATPVFRDYMYWVRTRSPEAKSWLLSFLWYGRKAEYFNPELEPKALDKWVQAEEKLRKVHLPTHVLEDLRRIVALSGLDFDVADMWPKHGPGQVAERLKVKTDHEKNKVLAVNSNLVRFFGTLGASGGPGAMFMLPNSQVWDEHPDMYRYAMPEDPVAQLWFVTKDEGSMRTICFECAAVMLAQQGVLPAFKKGLASSGFRHVVDIDDQDFNKLACWEACRTRRFDTLDLKGASDDVLAELVQAILPAKLWEFLDLTRSTRVMAGVGDNAVMVPVKKFAPMGSALCFPTQSMVFAAIMGLAQLVHRKGLDAQTYLSEGMEIVSKFPRYLSDERIFGDDIIVSAEYSRTMIQLLQALGFTVNTDKSFMGSQAFRESCGDFVYYDQRLKNRAPYDGCALVNPLIFKVTNLCLDNYDSWLALIRMANECYDRGWLGLRSKLVSYLPHGTYVEMSKDSPYANQSHVLWGNDVVVHKERYWHPDQRYIAEKDMCDHPEWPLEAQTWYRRVLVARKPFEDYYGEIVVGDLGHDDGPEALDPRDSRGNRIILSAGKTDLYDVYSAMDGRGRQIIKLKSLPDLESFAYGQYLFRFCQDVELQNDITIQPLSERLGHLEEPAVAPPRDGLVVTVSTSWRWTPIR